MRRLFGSSIRDRWTPAFHCVTAVVFCLAALASISVACAQDNAAVAQPSLKVLFVTGGGYHDYEKLAPFLTEELSARVNVSFQVVFDLDRLRDPQFANAFDVVVYDLCFDDVPSGGVENALAATRGGKPAVMIHCAVHAFRNSEKLSEWESCCGMRSKSHDRYGPFVVNKLDAESPITKSFPISWETPGDELYQTISIDPKAHPLLMAKSPQDGREHIVCWTHQYGKGRVFATTLGHDMQTTARPEFLELVSNGVLWASGKLNDDGQPAAGYETAKTVATLSTPKQ